MHGKSYNFHYRPDCILGVHKFARLSSHPDFRSVSDGAPYACITHLGTYHADCPIHYSFTIPEFLFSASNNFRILPWSQWL